MIRSARIDRGKPLSCAALRTRKQHRRRNRNLRADQ
jgi:hypothetical protein